MPPTPPDDQASAARGAFRRGAVAMAPLLLGVVPFGLVAGVASVEAGIGVVGAVAFSVVVFAGASQLAAITLLGSGAPAVVAIVTGVVINLRMLMYSASLAQQLADVSRRRRLLGAYLLTDQAYAVATADHAEHPDRASGARFALYVGGGLTLWATWQVATVVGAVAGGLVPDSVPLAFAIPLAFLSLVVPAVRDRAGLVAALVGGIGATVAATLPHNLGMPLGALLGVAAGWSARRLVAGRP